ncbi:hypothetical protein UFOVP965_141 [uncultured Caudovirales phage]|uniref:Uncharacterized protein n=1 Tax=uncultured Caudovirales phage TaxID=2100421 RepID=A0A6J5RAY8_9CAUD|nr:hypothetical protein UFOVP965_141 [uncultured Caudovirales phage]CAB4179930.1 hypothetical protein UFOVP1035_137 [uncultured Caudovirales phage]CAB4188784.1 hypothetical protein UFOVP1181_96 [uncultured Caudovirales phage]
MTIAPAPRFPEKPGNLYDRKMASALPGQRGPLRFEEGVATDTDVPQEFTKGAMQGYVPAAGRPNRNQNVFEKLPEETMRERAHVGSAAWTEAPEHLNEFASGAFADHGDNRFEEVIRNGAHQQALNPSVVQD